MTMTNYSLYYIYYGIITTQRQPPMILNTFFSCAMLYHCIINQIKNANFVNNEPTKKGNYYKTMRAASILDDNKPNYIPRVTNKRNTLLHSELNPDNFFLFENWEGKCLAGKYFWTKIQLSESFPASHATYVYARRHLEFCSCRTIH